MNSQLRRTCGGGFLAIALILSQSPLHADDSLASARDLYASAAYEDALAMLGRLNAAGAKADEGRVADQYRALCLLALGKTSEASLAIEAVVSADPAYHPADGEVSPGGDLGDPLITGGDKPLEKVFHLRGCSAPELSESRLERVAPWCGLFETCASCYNKMCIGFAPDLH